MELVLTNIWRRIYHKYQGFITFLKSHYVLANLFHQHLLLTPSAIRKHGSIAYNWAVLLKYFHKTPNATTRLE